MKRKILSLLLSFTLCLTLLPMAAFAEEPDKISITTVDELLQFAKAVDNSEYDDKTDAVVSLDADLDLTGVAWKPIGSVFDGDGNLLHYFSGKFYGNGHTISNLDFSENYGMAEYPVFGFFSVAYGAEISGLTIQGKLDVSNSGYVFFGTVAGVAENSKISDCVSDVSFTDTDKYINGPAALCGYAINSTIEHCQNKGNFSVTTDTTSLQMGGIVGVADNSTVQYCANTGDMTSWTPHTGGIVGQLYQGSMTYLPANYTKVDAAIAKANALNKDNYMDFSGVEAAVNAVVRGKNITEQSEVDAMAKVIEEAINALVRKSSGGDDSDPTYAIEVGKDIRNGTVTANRRYAERGDTVTITVKPDDGFKLDDLTVTDKNGKELKLTDKGNGKYTFTMPASKVEIKATFVKEVETSPFSDVSTSAYYYEAVKWAQEKDITGGIGNGLFGPNQPCTRAQIVTFLWRAAGSPEPKSMSSFSDVSADSYYAKAVAWAVENGITTGTGDGKFSPDATCTREQAVAFLYRASGSPAVSGGSAFSDVAANAYYADAVAWAEKNGVTGGIGGGLFGSGNTCTRAQIVTFLYRAYQGK